MCPPWADFKVKEGENFIEKTKTGFKGRF